jgi:hypothetical protein
MEINGPDGEGCVAAPWRTFAPGLLTIVETSRALNETRVRLLPAQSQHVQPDTHMGLPPLTILRRTSLDSICQTAHHLTSLSCASVHIILAFRRRSELKEKHGYFTSVASPTTKLPS